MTPTERAEAAKLLLESPVIQAAFADIRNTLVSQAELTAMDDVTSHHETVISLQLLKQLKTQLKHYVDAQTISEHKRKEETYIEKMRETLSKFRA